MCKLSPPFLSPTSHKISYRNLKSIDLELLSNSLSQKLLSLPSYQDTYAQFKFYNDSLKDVLDDFAPLITKLIQRRKTLFHLLILTDLISNHVPSRSLHSCDADFFLCSSYVF